MTELNLNLNRPKTKPFIYLWARLCITLLLSLSAVQHKTLQANAAPEGAADSGKASEASHTSDSLESPYYTERFFTHITTQARTLSPGKVAFETFPGANMYTSFLLNSLSVGLTNHIQVGTTPLLFTSDSHQFNLNLKINPIKKRYFQFGYGVSYFRFDLSESDAENINGVPVNEIDIDLYFAYVAFNYRDPGSKFSFGYNYSRGQTRSNSAAINDALSKEFKRRSEWAFDTSYRYDDRWAVTTGFGEQREELFEIASRRIFGFGFSITHLAPRKRFPRITAGLHYSPEAEKTSALLSFDI